MAVLAPVAIANRALSKLGKARIFNLADDDRGAKAMNSRYEPMRDNLLQEYPWRFSLHRMSLPADTTAPEWGYSLRYLLPPDYLQLRSLADLNVHFGDGVYYRTGYAGNHSETPFEILGQYIQTDFSAPLDIEYIRVIEDSSKFPPLFSEALACRLAYDAAEELTNNDQKKRDAKRDEKEAISRAYRSDAIMRPANRRGPSTWQIARRVI